MFWKALISITLVGLGVVALGFAFFDAAGPNAAKGWAWGLVVAALACFVAGGLLARGGFRRNPPEIDRALAERRDARHSARDRRSASEGTPERRRITDTKTRPPLG